MKPEQLEAIRKRSSATSGNWLADYLKLQSAQIVLTDDVPALIDEVERLQKVNDLYENYRGDIEYAMHKVGRNNDRISEAEEQLAEGLSKLNGGES